MGTGLQGDALYNLTASHILRAGFFVSADRARTGISSSVLPVDAGGRQVSDTPQSVDGRFVDHETKASLYVQDEWKPFTPLTVNFGLRFDHVAGPRTESHLSPRVNAVWTGASGTTVHVGYARYFIPAPQADQVQMAGLLIGTTGALPTAHADPVRSELDNYYDIGVQQKLDGLTLGVDGYWRDAANLIDDGQFGTAMIRTPFNYATGHIRGVEFSMTYAEGPLSAWSNLSVARAEGRRIVSNQAYFTPAQLAFVRDHFVHLDQDQTYTVSAGASYQWRELRLSGDLIYGSGFRKSPVGGPPNGATLPGHVQVNLSGVYDLWPASRYSLALRVDVINLLGAKYEIQDGTSLGAGPPQWGPGRGLFAGFEQSF